MVLGAKSGIWASDCNLGPDVGFGWWNLLRTIPMCKYIALLVIKAFISAQQVLWFRPANAYAQCSKQMILTQQLTNPSTHQSTTLCNVHSPSHHPSTLFSSPPIPSTPTMPSLSLHSFSAATPALLTAPSSSSPLYKSHLSHCPHAPPAGRKC